MFDGRALDSETSAEALKGGEIVDTTAEPDITSLISGFEQLAERFVSGLFGRFAALGDVPVELESLRASLVAGGTSLLALLFEIVLVVLLVASVFILLARRLRKASATSSAWRRFFAGVAATVVALVIGFIAARLLAGSGVPLQTLRLWTVATVLGFIILAAVRSLLMASRRSEFAERSVHLAALVRDLSLAIGLAIISVALLGTLRLWSVGPALGDLLRTGLGIPIYLLFAWAVWRHRRTMAVAVAGPRPRGRWRTLLAKMWPAIVIAFLIITFLSTQAALTLGASLRGSAVLLTGLVFLAAPHLDAMIGNWAQRGLESPDISILAAAGRQTARFTVVAIMIAMLGTLWATPLAAGFGIDLREVAKGASGVALIMLVAAFLWNVVGTATARALRAELPAVSGDEEALGAPRSRLGTLVPLISAVGKSSILALALLSILVSIGVNVWPLIAGLSVFGLAIGFGSQTLVKDVVSGLFFLIDDAFRFGEYIETSGAKGTVEKISVRSVSLRHQRGALATIPYGEIGKIQNFSRDWMIEKLVFRVAFNTDVEKVRKIFKKIGQEMSANPELAADMLEPFKSQGIAEVEDGTLVIRAKFKAKAGRNFMIRRAALIAVHQAFQEHGIQAVPKPLTSNPGAA
ncbi:mechanosensitive ion channel domain-containing protein [Mesorhizobium amorphae]|uniref:Mechanosensitive ion channel MscS n=1 Tax=Mesorhizobium amorphae CCNWGS0123 TaxID=1082933 RepID=G6YE57_9HYPH|nr:mechanosensitive ion channel domain-containing protein [Mesorhizobium amorphae]EHH09998.1 mechanosensitive ion channel MscS [Mesorhizobium amorphae CCNWGS0123]GLR39571.1 mechanosensitive ion channel protein MscS [Mesorhizobium amorphae]